MEGSGFGTSSCLTCGATDGREEGPATEGACAGGLSLLGICDPVDGASVFGVDIGTGAAEGGADNWNGARDTSVVLGAEVVSPGVRAVVTSAVTSGGGA